MSIDIQNSDFLKETKSYSVGGTLIQISVFSAVAKIVGGTSPDNPLDDRVSLIEHKSLASMKVTVDSRAHTVHRDLKKRAEDLDSRHPGSTFSQELASRAPLQTSRVTSTPLWI